MNMNAKNQINTVTRSGEWAITAGGLLNFMTQDRELAQSKIKELSSNDSCEMRDWLSVYFNQRESMKIEDGSAFIHVKGCLLCDASPMDLAMGNSSYTEIIEDIETAELNSTVNNIVLIVDSPGGTVQGMIEAQSAISNISKKTYAYIMNATSAAYGLASQCDYVVSTPSGTSGNIGTILSWMDYSKYLESMGITTRVMTNQGADLKGTFSENPMTESQKAFLTERLNMLGENFWDSVKAIRPQVNDECKRAGWYQPEQAGELGLIDMVASEKEFLNFIETNVDSFEA